MSKKPRKQTQPQHVDTGGGAFVAGDVRVEGGGFVGRDKVVVQQATQEVTVEDFLRLLAQVREMLPTAGLDPDTAQIIESDLEVAESQAQQEEPRGAIVLAKLKPVAEILGAAGGAATGIARLLPLVQQALQWAQHLFQ